MIAVYEQLKRHWLAAGPGWLFLAVIITVVIVLLWPEPTKHQPTKDYHISGAA